MEHPMRFELTRVGLLVEFFLGFVLVYIEIIVLYEISVPPPFLVLPWATSNKNVLWRKQQAENSNVRSK